jgi:hypothetical protein
MRLNRDAEFPRIGIPRDNRVRRYRSNGLAIDNSRVCPPRDDCQNHYGENNCSHVYPPPLESHPAPRSTNPFGIDAPLSGFYDGDPTFQLKKSHFTAFWPESHFEHYKGVPHESQTP